MTWNLCFIITVSVSNFSLRCSLHVLFFLIFSFFFLIFAQIQKRIHFYFISLRIPAFVDISCSFCKLGIPSRKLTSRWMVERTSIFINTHCYLLRFLVNELMDEWHQMLRSNYETKQLLNKQNMQKRWTTAVISCAGKEKKWHCFQADVIKLNTRP